MGIPRLSLLVVILLTLAPRMSTASAAAAPPPPVPKAASAADAARTFESRYGITLVTQPPAPSKLSAQLRVTPVPPGPHRNAPEHLRIIDEELARYSPGLLRATGVSKLALVQSLDYRNVATASHVDVDAGVWYWNLGYPSTDDFLRHGIHFDLFAAIDSRLNDAIAGEDPAWMYLNDRRFKYGPGGRIVSENFKADHSDASPGFVSRYARTGVREDKAETFANLMRPEAKAWLDQQVTRDLVLAAKVDYLRDLIRYHEAVKPDSPQEQASARLMTLIKADDLKPLATFCYDESNRETLNARGWAGRTPLHRVLLTPGARNAPTVLFESEAIDLNAADDRGWTPLHLAAYRHDTETAVNLIRRGADRNLKDRQGGTAEDWAKLRGYADTAKAIRTTQYIPPPPVRPGGLRARPGETVTVTRPRSP